MLSAPRVNDRVPPDRPAQRGLGRRADKALLICTHHQLEAEYKMLITNWNSV